MLKKYNAIVFIGLMILGFSCVEDIEIDTGEELPIVVDCVLQNSPVQTLKLYRLRHLYKDDYNDINGAGVELFKESSDGKKYEKVAEFLQKDGPEWEAHYQPEFGAKYKLMVSVNGKEQAHAYTTFPEDLKLVLHLRLYDTLNVNYFTITGEVSEPKYVHYWGKYPEIVSETPFKVYEKSLKPCKMWLYPHTDTTIVMKPDNKYSILQEEEVRFSGSSKPYARYVVTDHSGADDFNVVSGNMSDIDFFNVPVGSYEYDTNSFLQVIHLNISQWCPLVKPDLPLHEGFVRIDHPKGFNNGFYGERLDRGYQYSSGSFFIFGDYDNYWAGFSPFSLEVRFLSDEYDKFLKELHIKKSSRDDFILSTYERKNFYTNIEGGLGVFGAENTTWAENAYWLEEMWWLILLLGGLL